MSSEHDSLRRFLIGKGAVRGEWLHLDRSWQVLLERVDYPPAVRRRLGEAVIATMLLAATIKFDGSLVFQINGSGPLRRVVVQATGKKTFRGLATWDGDVPDADLETQFGQGQLVMTIEPGKGQERYQGIVGLQGDSIVDLVEHYFQHSEQLPTRLWVAESEQAVAGLLLQAMPSDDEDDIDWQTALTLAQTVTDAELLELDTETLLHRLFNEFDVRLFERDPVSFRCSCSRERIEDMLRQLGKADLEDLLREQNEHINVDCEFCGANYGFDSVDVEGLFADSVVMNADADTDVRH